MDATTYQQLAARTLIDAPGFDITPDQVMLVWCAVGLAGEAGEFCELVKKGIFHQHGFDRERAAKELGDVLWYVAALATRLDLDLSALMEANIEKLRQRYPAGYTPADSVRRVDVRGL